MDNVTVSVCVVTYNHEKYISECLDSVLNQKTNFCFNIFVSDDCSQDNTLSILNSYKEKFQNIIVTSRCGLPKSSFNGRPTGNMNGVENLNRANGEFVAICDGDDRWDDVYKLQKQVDALRANREVALVCTAKKKLENQIIKEPRIRIPNLIFSSKWLCFYNPVPASSVMFRRSLYKSPPNWINSLPIGDWPIWFSICRGKKILKLSEPSLTYRVHSLGAWGGLRKYEKAYSSLITVGTLMKQYNDFELRISYLLHSIRYWFYRLLKR